MLSSVSWLQPPEEYWKHLAQQVAAPPAQLAAVQYAFRPLSHRSRSCAVPAAPRAATQTVEHPAAYRAVQLAKRGGGGGGYQFAVHFDRKEE